MQQYISTKELAKRFGVHPITVWRWAKKPGFPIPIKLTSNTVRFDLEAVQKWVAERESATRGDPPLPPPVGV